MARNRKTLSDIVSDVKMDEFVSATDIAKKLRLRPETARRLLDDAKVPSYSFSSRAMRWKLSDVEAFLESHMAQQGEKLASGT
jgi:predicted DNA-binding transcriptional regulator AlpA